MLRLSITKESPSWVVVDKPAGFHTHPPEDKAIRVNPRRDALTILQRQLGEKLYPAHRLDRAASGLLVYSRRRERNADLQRQFQDGVVRKTYFVVVRGEIREDLTFDQPLARGDGAPAPAVTHARACFSFALPIPHPRGGGDRRFTALAVTIETGRFHQIRRHFAQAGWPLVGDSRHGDRQLNRAFAALTGCDNLFLRCMQLEFSDEGAKVNVQARWSREWHRLFEHAGTCPLTASPSRARRKPS